MGFETKVSHKKAKAPYEKPRITEEMIFEQRALACAPALQSRPGEEIGCSKQPGTPGPWWS